ncbi:MAG: hypothetical protein NT046_06255 [Arenimonas sp.]|nr:hypothetical protein [Arenimonas sp.]
MTARTEFFRKLLVVAQRLFVPLAVGSLAFAAYAARGSFGDILANARTGPLVLTVVAWSLLHLVVPVVGWRVLGGLGTGIGYRTMLRIHVARLPARYLPGGIWQTVSRVVDLHGIGVTRAQLSVLVAMENLAPLATALALGGTLAWAAGSAQIPAPAAIAAGLALAAGLPWLMRRFIRGAALPIGSYLAAVATTLVFWIGAAGTFVVYWSAFPAVFAAAEPPGLMAAYLLAWAAGFVAIIAPQGIGVFEAVAGMLLDGALPLATMTVMVAGFRAATLLGDGLAWLVGLALAWTVRRRAAH